MWTETEEELEGDHEPGAQREEGGPLGGASALMEGVGGRGWGRAW